jgi:Tropinone reductase 1
MNGTVNQRWSLKGRRAVVAGGTKGIGAAICEELLGFGADVFFVARNEGDIRRAEKGWSEANGDASGWQADLSKPEDRERTVREIERRWDGLDILVYNAGTNLRKRTVDFSSEEVDFILQTNLLSAYELTRKLHPMLAAGTEPAVVFMASVAGLTGLRTGTPYAMSKAALIQLARSLALEWGPDGIRVNAVAPWYIATPLTEPVLSKENFRTAVLRRTPLGRIGEAREVAAAVAFLVMPAASYISGQCLAVDGGFLAYGFTPP